LVGTSEEDQVIMVGHQSVAIQLAPGDPEGKGENVQEGRIVLSFPEQLEATGPSGEDVPAGGSAVKSLQA
jgi:hypothetical protein